MPQHGHPYHGKRMPSRILCDIYTQKSCQNEDEIQKNLFLLISNSYKEIKGKKRDWRERKDVIVTRV
jgi:hypothetical protein